MEDLIPIIVILLISLVGIATRKKKKNILNQDIAENPIQHAQDDVFSWFEKLADTDGETRQHIPKPDLKPLTEPVLQEVKAEKRKSMVEDRNEDVNNTAYKKYTGFIAPHEKHTINKESHQPLDHKPYKSSRNEQIEMLKLSKKPSKKHALMQDFSLHKAVVYAEILNRKYH